MKSILLILIFSISLLQAKTWSSYTSMNCGISYAFTQDSLVQIRSTEINQDVVLSISCTDNGFDDTFPITDSIGNIVGWEEKHISVTGYSIHFFDESNPAEDSLWAKHLNTWDTIDTIDIKEFILFNNDSISFDSIYRKDLRSSSNFLILYKGANYNAFCHIKSGLCTGKYSISCQYQDDGSLRFAPFPKMPSDCNYPAKINSIKKENTKKLQKIESYFVNGTHPIKSSSNVVIENKQPTLQLKGVH